MLPQLACYELVIPACRWRNDSRLGFTAARQPGSLHRPTPQGAILFIAPGRWLVVGDALEAEAQAIARMQAADAAVIDVTAKWCRLHIAGTEAHGSLSRVLDLHQVLGKRDCASVTVLDCPAVLARCEGGYELWVTRSCVEWLCETLVRLPGWSL